MLTIDGLKTFGANTEEGLQRCMGFEALYLKLVKTIPEEKHFGMLKDALAVHDLDAAFEAVHALKGVLGNLSLTPLYDLSVEMTEHLRVKDEANCQELLEKMFEKKAELEALCAE
ncbi:MAG: Hpt domain-containing protein [Blautia sp.]|nr:Hpt domain-containing protein [Blautia sp.]